MSFPSSLPSYTTPTSAQTLAAAGHTTLHVTEEADIIGIATKMGIGASTPSNGMALVGNGVGTSAWRTLTSSDVGLGNVSNVSESTILQAVYPVGCIYAETTGVNPNTTFGFGTWVQTGQGRVLIGQGTSDQLFTAGFTGGESNHTLTGAESGTSVHGHGVTDPTHTHGSSNSGKFLTDAAGGATAGAAVGAASSALTAAASTGVTVNNSTATNASNSHNNLQPYQVIYYWTRNA